MIKMEEKKKFSFPKLTKEDKIAITILIIFIIFVSIPVYTPKGECEVARPGYKCESAKNVMIENCEYWAEYECDTTADTSLVQIEWYIQSLCEYQSGKEPLDCANLKMACNQVSGKDLC
jgi:hypothetical protein